MKKLFHYLLVFILVLISGFTCQAQAQKKAVVSPTTSTIEVIQFHSEHRCVTCLKIEKLTKETLAKSFKTVPFRLVNVDEKKNEKMAEQFEATGTALFLYNPKTGKKKDLTDFAFMKAGDEKAFDTEFKKYIEDFIKG